MDHDSREGSVGEGMPSYSIAKVALETPIQVAMIYCNLNVTCSYPFGKRPLPRLVLWSDLQGPRTKSLLPYKTLSQGEVTRRKAVLIRFRS